MELKIVQHAVHNIGPVLPAVGQDGKAINQAQLRGMSSVSNSPGIARRSQFSRDAPLEEQLYDARAYGKIAMSNVAMHIEPEWRKRFFCQLDDLLDVENWEESDPPVGNASFDTLLRMFLLLRPTKRPGLGATTAGNIVATWATKSKLQQGKYDRLTIECFPRDSVRWVLSVYNEEDVDRSVGETRLIRLKSVLEPFSPSRWFD